MKQAFADLVGSFFPQIDYFAFYPGTLKAMSADKKKVDVDPDNKKLLPGMGSIRLKLGMPGATVDVEPGTGSRLLIGFEEGDPSKPYAMLWEQGEHVNHATLTADKITLNASGAQPVHRKGDHEKAGTLMAAWMGQVEVFINGLVPGTITPLSTTFVTTPGIAVASDGSPTVEAG